MEEIAELIELKLNNMGLSEILSSTIGEEVMEHLRQVDKVAYIRFASIYREFQDVTEFKDEIAILEKV